MMTKGDYQKGDHQKLDQQGLPKHAGNSITQPQSWSTSSTCSLPVRPFLAYLVLAEGPLNLIAKVGKPC